VRRVSQRRDDDLQFRSLNFPTHFISLALVARTSIQYQIWCAESYVCWFGDIFCHPTLSKLDLGDLGPGAPKLSHRVPSPQLKVALPPPRSCHQKISTHLSHQLEYASLFRSGGVDLEIRTPVESHPSACSGTLILASSATHRGTNYATSAQLPATLSSAGEAVILIVPLMRDMQGRNTKIVVEEHQVRLPR